MTMFSSFWMANAGADAFSVDNSMLLNDDDSQYLIRENASNSGSGRTKFTISLWWKHGNIPSGGQNLFIQRNSSSNYMKCAIAGSGGNEAALQFFGATLGAFGTGDSTALLRDFHAWYHILFYYDSMDSTAGDRARIYLNGVRLTDFQTSATNPSLGAITQFGSNNAIVIGQNQGASGYSDGYMAEMAVVDGNALLPSSFTEADSNGVLRPIEIKAENLLNFVGLYQKRKLRAGDLSFGQQKLLELAMALMNEPQMLLLDEPTAGINPTLINGIISGSLMSNSTTEEKKERVTCNIKHLEVMLAKTDWKDEDMTASNKAITDGKAYVG